MGKKKKNPYRSSFQARQFSREIAMSGLRTMTLQMSADSLERLALQKKAEQRTSTKGALHGGKIGSAVKEKK